MNRSLPPRKAELLSLLLTDKSSLQIAHEMGLTHGSARVAMKRLFGKLSVKWRIELMARERQALLAALAWEKASGIDPIL